MNRPKTVQPPAPAPRWLRALSPTVVVLSVVVAVYGAGSLLEAALTQAVVA